MSLKVTVDGQPRELDVDPEMPILWALRDVLGLTGAKYGCGQALCGACVVHLDGDAVRACVTPIRRAAGATVTTIDGLSPNGDHPLQQAWVELRGAAVRVLPGRADHDRGGAPRQEPDAHRRGDRSARSPATSAAAGPTRASAPR